MVASSFQPNANKTIIKQLFRDGAQTDGDSLDEIAKTYGVSVRTVWRYLKEVQNEPPPGEIDINEINNTALQVKDKKTIQTNSIRKTLPASTLGVSKAPFTPAGTETPAPLGTPAGQQYLTIGTFRMPLEDWGYSSSLNLLIVAETFDQAKKEYGFDRRMKVGDFIAELCQAFRIMRGWDVIGLGYNKALEEATNDNGQCQH